MKALLLLLLAWFPTLVSAQRGPAPVRKSVPEKLAYFLRLTDTLRQQTHTAGLAMAIIYDHQPLYKGGQGYRDIARKLPVTTRTLFEIGSCTKAFTGVVASHLVQAGTLRWDDTVRAHLPEFTLADAYATHQATVQDLLTHRVGMDQHYYLSYGPPLARHDLLAKLPYLSFRGSFRQKFLYNNFLYTAAGIVEERVTHTAWEELIRGHIFRPLGMHHSFTTFEEYQRYPEAAVSYRSDGRTVVPATSIEGMAPAGSITSTIDDMARWVEMLTNKGVLEGKPFLTPQQFAYLTSPLTVRNAAEEIFYGIGWDIDTKRRIIYHDGRTAGQSSRILFMPEQGFGIVILCNQQSELQNLLVRYATNIFIDDNYAKMPDFEAFVASKAAQRSPSPPKQPPVRLANSVRQELTSCVGRYTHPAYGVLTLAVMAKNQFSFAYYDFKGLVSYTAGAGFCATTQHVTGPDTFPFTIIKDARQQVTGVKVEFPYAQPVLFTKVKDTEKSSPARSTSLP